MNKKPYKQHPPKLYVVKFGDTVYLYDDSEANWCASSTLKYYLNFLYVLDDDDDQELCSGPDIYAECSDIDRIDPPDRVLVNDPGENWYKFDDEDDKNTEETYNKYLDHWQEYCICNHLI